ncbi:hypothetical protein BGX27_003548 [Mortierella sp. AM989]|nr:hypothetical protein BGX27_003548 [Mortierella sp. AM989]
MAMQDQQSIRSGSEMIIDGALASTGRITTDEYVQINGVAMDGSECSPNGLIGQDGAGQILSCQAGVWRKPRASTIIRQSTRQGYRWPSASVSCADHEQVVGGGGTCAQPNNVIWLTKSIPQDNGWFIQCDGGFVHETELGTASVWAICL